MFFSIKISAKDKRVLCNFLKVLCESPMSTLFLKLFSDKRIKKVVTVLKSPHVNKSAQEKFEFRIFSKSIRRVSFQSLRDLVNIKKIQEHISPGVKLRIKFSLEKTYGINGALFAIRSSHGSVKFFDQKKEILKINAFQLMYLFDSSGELILQSDLLKL